MMYVNFDFNAILSTDKLQRRYTKYLFFIDGYCLATNSYILVRRNLDLMLTNENDSKLLNGFCMDQDQIKTLNKLKDITIEYGIIKGLLKGVETTINLKVPDSDISFPTCYNNIIDNAISMKTSSKLNLTTSTLKVLSKLFKHNTLEVETKESLTLIKSMDNEYDQEIVLVQSIKL